jgi:rubrerythrin
MTKNNDPKVLADFINCLSILENDTFHLYAALSEKIELPLVKSLLLAIAEDSLKHSTLLKGVAESITKTKETPKDCAKKTGEAWRLLANFSKKIAAKEKFSEEQMSQLSVKLAFLESIIGEEYYVFVQMKTLEFMMKEINQIYSIDLGSLKSIFTRIINDEEHHREMLGTIKGILERKPEPSNNPVVKYQNPDSWISSLPPTS